MVFWKWEGQSGDWDVGWSIWCLGSGWDHSSDWEVVGIILVIGKWLGSF